MMLDLRTAPGCKILLKHKQPVPTHQAQILCPQSRALSTVPLLRYKVSESRGPADRSHIWAARSAQQIKDQMCWEQLLLLGHQAGSAPCHAGCDAPAHEAQPLLSFLPAGTAQHPQSKSEQGKSLLQMPWLRAHLPGSPGTALNQEGKVPFLEVFLGRLWGHLTPEFSTQPYSAAAPDLAQAYREQTDCRNSSVFPYEMTQQKI